MKLKYFIRVLYTSGYLIDTLFGRFMDPWFRSDYKAVGRSENLGVNTNVVGIIPLAFK